MTAPIKLSEIERLGKRTKHKCIPGEKLTNYYWEYSRATNPLTVTKLAEALRIAHGALDKIRIQNDHDLDAPIAIEAITKISELVEL